MKRWIVLVLMAGCGGGVQEAPSKLLVTLLGHSHIQEWNEANKHAAAPSVFAEAQWHAVLPAAAVAHPGPGKG